MTLLLKAFISTGIFIFTGEFIVTDDFIITDDTYLQANLLPSTNEVWDKVIFSQASVILSMGGGGGLPVCITGHMTGGSAQPHPHRQTQRDCPTLPVCRPPGCRPPPQRYMGYYGIRSTNGRYASYWYAFLFIYKCKVKCDVLIYIHKQNERLLAATLQLCVCICLSLQLSDNL